MKNFTKVFKGLMEDNKIKPETLKDYLKFANNNFVYDWKNGKTMPTLTTANEIANFFNCSLDYLAGRTDDFKTVKAQSLKPFGENLRKAIDNSKFSQNKIIRELNVSTHSIVSWLNNKTIPNFSSVIKLADYLNISIDELVGRD